MEFAIGAGAYEMFLKPLLDPQLKNSSRFFENIGQFYEVGSSIWATLRVGEKYKYQAGGKEKFRELIAAYAANGFRNPDQEYGDLLLGEEIFDIDTLIVNSMAVKVEGTKA